MYRLTIANKKTKKMNPCSYNIQDVMIYCLYLYIYLSFVYITTC